VPSSALIVLQMMSKPYCALPSGQDSLRFESTHSGQRTPADDSLDAPLAKTAGRGQHIKDIFGMDQWIIVDK
jgi:hypothetical protein